MCDQPTDGKRKRSPVNNVLSNCHISVICWVTLVMSRTNFWIIFAAQLLFGVDVYSTAVLHIYYRILFSDINDIDVMITAKIEDHNPALELLYESRIW